MIFVMFTGHGFQTDNYGGYSPYVGFAPEDAIPDRSTVVDFSTTVSLSKLFDDLKESKARFKWALIDACRENLDDAGLASSAMAATKALARSKSLRNLAAPPGVAILQSCGEGEYSWEDPKRGRGGFTSMFAESLTELGDANEDGVVTFLEAAERAMTETKRETSNRRNYGTTQTPYLSGNMMRFALADVNAAKARRLWEEIVKARETGDYAAALAKIEEAIALMPSKPEYETEKRTIERLADAERRAREAESKAKAEAEARAAAEKAKADAERQARNSGSSTGRTSTASGDWSGSYAAGTAKSLDIKGVKYTFHYCPAGTFTTGGPKSEKGRRDDETQHKVTLTNGFWMLETEVTRAMWESATGENPSAFS